VRRGRPWCLLPVANEDLRINSGLVIPAIELTETASRSSGPGGQHVNKTSTRVTLRWNAQASPQLSAAQRGRLIRQLGPRITRAGNLIVHCGASRSRAKNRETARERLAALVRDGLHSTRRRVPTRPGKGARERRLSEKKQRSTTKRQRGRVRNRDD
jgi:ribosome-associated protein